MLAVDKLLGIKIAFKILILIILFEFRGITFNLCGCQCLMKFKIK